MNKNETDLRVVKYLNHVMTCYSDMAMCNEPELWVRELMEVDDIISSCYDTDKFNKILTEKISDLSTIGMVQKRSPTLELM